MSAYPAAELVGLGARCTGCTACCAACRSECLSMRTDGLGFRYPIFDSATCTSCGACVRACPILSPPVLPEGPLRVLAAQSVDDDARLASSSGGVFAAIARATLMQGGAVFGAAFDAEHHVIHARVDDEAALPRLMGSKYVQSDLGDTLRSVRTALQDGRKVLFAGTPCQVAGLRTLLRSDSVGLTCVDLICHGVPSGLLLDAYLDHRIRRDGHARSDLRAVTFRDKASRGWRRFGLRIDYSDGSSYSHWFNTDEFGRAYISNAFLRPSCRACAFKSRARVSDLTLGDYWGVEEQVPHMHDDRGTSVVLVQSLSGLEIWDRLAGGFRWCEADLDSVNEANEFLTSSATSRISAAEAYVLLARAGLERALPKIDPTPLRKRVKRALKGLLRASAPDGDV